MGKNQNELERNSLTNIPKCTNGLFGLATQLSFDLAGGKPRFYVWQPIHSLSLPERIHTSSDNIADSKFHGANMRPILGRQDADGPHVGPMNFAIWDGLPYVRLQELVMSDPNGPHVGPMNFAIWDGLLYLRLQELVTTANNKHPTDTHKSQNNFLGAIKV